MAIPIIQPKRYTPEQAEAALLGTAQPPDWILQVLCIPLEPSIYEALSRSVLRKWIQLMDVNMAPAPGGQGLVMCRWFQITPEGHSRIAALDLLLNNKKAD